MGIKHTPGPWVARKTGGAGWPGQIGWAIDFNEIQEQVVDFVYEEADAHLIAAAPELLEALSDALADFDNWAAHEDNYPHEHLVAWAEKARAAIAKAKGEEQ